MTKHISVSGLARTTLLQTDFNNPDHYLSPVTSQLSLTLLMVMSVLLTAILLLYRTFARLVLECDSPKLKGQALPLYETFVGDTVGYQHRPLSWFQAKIPFYVTDFCN
jgi:hypothetical protein